MNERRTRIVCTIGPASNDEGVIERLIEAGMNVARLNMSHGTQEEHAAVLARIRDCAARTGVPVAVMQDLQGPKIRTGSLAGGGPVQLMPGAPLDITTTAVSGTSDRISTGYPLLPRIAEPGGRLLLSDGLIELRVESVEGDTIHTRVVQGGTLFERQGINVPGAVLNAPSLTEKDVADLRWGIAHEVDYVAVSFVRRPEDIEAARAAIREAGADIPLIAKLEKAQALSRLDDILAVAAGVMVARGDMGVELPPEEVPGWQKRIIAAANRRLVPVITATQMLESMVHNPRPTRAEATDVANAIWDGTDAVMLSAETAAGEYPVEAVTMMDRIARAAEREPEHQLLPEVGAERAGYPETIAASVRAACAALRGVATVVAYTRDGATARLMSKERPAAPVLALTDDERVYRRTALYWGIHAALAAQATDLPTMLSEAERAVRAAGLAHPGDTVLVVGHLPPEAPGSTNFMTLHAVR